MVKYDSNGDLGTWPLDFVGIGNAVTFCKQCLSGKTLAKVKGLNVLVQSD